MGRHITPECFTVSYTEFLMRKFEMQSFSLLVVAKFNFSNQNVNKENT